VGADSEQREIAASHPHIHLVASDRIQSSDDEPATEAAAPTIEEDPIEATIRRVAEAKIAREQELAPAESTDAYEVEPATADQSPWESVESSEPAEPDLEPDPIEEAIRRVAAAKAERDRMAVDTAEIPLDRPTTAPADLPQPADGPDHVELVRVVARLESELASTQQEVRNLATRLEAIESRDGSGLLHPPHRSSALSQSEADDDFDDAPQISRMAFGAPPRPAIFRDPSPHTATAEQLVPEFEESSEAVAEAAPVASATEARRGLDLLPRSYRVTVEDKRRDVDLVPLHRALLQMHSIKDMSLLSYSNGVAIISLETIAALDPDELCATVARAMARPARVEVHNDTTMVVKLSEE
jgi:hypothetical protein